MAASFRRGGGLPTWGVSRIIEGSWDQASIWVVTEALLLRWQDFGRRVMVFVLALAVAANIVISCIVLARVSPCSEETLGAGTKVTAAPLLRQLSAEMSVLSISHIWLAPDMFSCDAPILCCRVTGQWCHSWSRSAMPGYRRIVMKTFKLDGVPLDAELA